MPIVIETFDECQALAESWIAAEFGGEDLALDAYHGKWSRILALALWSLKSNVQDADAEWPPSSSSSTSALDAAAVAFGLANGSGGYGRKGATIATGGAGALTATKGTIYSIGSQLLGPDGVTVFALDAGHTVPGIPPGADTVANCGISAVTAGAAGNLLVGAQLQWITPPAGNVGPFALTTALAGGTDIESDADLLQRIFDTLRAGMRITPGDIRAIAEAVQGIYRAWVYSRRSGTGSVDVALTQVGTGTHRPAASTTATQAAFDADRNAGMESLTAILPLASSHSVACRVTASPTYPWDFDSSTDARTVAAHAIGPVRVTLSGAAWADIAVNDRIQIVTTGLVVPQIATVTVLDVSTPSAPILTLSVPSTWVAPTNGDAVHAGSAFAVPCAQAIVDLCDLLGPSKQSGFADESGGGWDDTLRVDQIRRVVLNQTDASGVPYLREFVAGTGPVVDGYGVDVQATDNLGTAPQLLAISHAVVTP